MGASKTILQPDLIGLRCLLTTAWRLWTTRKATANLRGIAIKGHYSVAEN